MRNFLVFLAAWCLATSAAAARSSGSTLRSDDSRVASVAFVIGTRGAALCPEAQPLSGLLLHHLIEYEGDGREYQIARHALDRGPGVLAVVADSPAAKAGIAAGDTLLAVDGQPFPDPRQMVVGRRAGNWRAPIEASEALLEAALRRGPVELRLLRNGTIQTVVLGSVRGCPARARLAQSDQVNAFSTGTHVVITTRILAALRSDDELAIVIGHELAHNVLRHEQGMSRRRNRAAEAEADRLGLRLAAAAGYDVRAAVPMWRRLYRQFGGGLPGFRRHPSLRTRERIIEEVVAQLGQPAA